MPAKNERPQSSSQAAASPVDASFETAPSASLPEGPEQTAADPMPDLVKAVPESESGEKRLETGPVPAQRTALPDATIAESPPVQTKRKSVVRPVVLSTLLVIGVAVLARYGSEWWNAGRFMISTDDAYIGAEMASISSQLNARIAHVAITANQPVRKGDILFTLDDTDFKLALDAATAKVATQKAERVRIVNQIAANTTALDQVAAQVDQAKAQQDQANAQSDAAAADLTRAQAAYDRSKKLAASDFGSKATLDNAIADLSRAKSGVASAAAATATASAGNAGAKAAMASARANILVLEAQRDEVDQVIKELNVTEAKALHDLDRIAIRAPLDGVIAAKSAQVGDFASVGKRLTSIVPMDTLYVDANFKETQVKDVVPGTPVLIYVDAIGKDRPIKGIVSGLAPGTGSVFSLLPADNATGNFTKIVQRVPVRIALDPANQENRLLRPGLSVSVELDMRDAQAIAKTSADATPKPVETSAP
jgi:membrane fusion protein, multidrug efflux system